MATGFALAVVHPPAGNIGGGGFMLIRMADGKAHFLDYREKAPAAATRDMYLDAQGNVIEGASEFGYKAIGVPGSVAGMVYAEQKYGKLTLKQVMAPAIQLARDGYALTWEEARDLQDDKYLGQVCRVAANLSAQRRTTTSRGRFSASPIWRGRWSGSQKNRMTSITATMARELAAAMQKGGGLITADDLAHYEVKEREPIRGTYRGYEIISAPPPSSGGIVLMEILNILEGYDLAKLGNRSAESIHLHDEAFRRAFFDRAEFLGDPDFCEDSGGATHRQEICARRGGKRLIQRTPPPARN